MPLLPPVVPLLLLELERLVVVPELDELACVVELPELLEAPAVVLEELLELLLPVAVDDPELVPTGPELELELALLEELREPRIVVMPPSDVEEDEQARGTQQRTAARERDRALNMCLHPTPGRVCPEQSGTC